MSTLSRTVLFLFCAGLASCSGASAEPAPPQSASPRNIILMIGDGMGISQITLARLLHGPLALDRFPVTGLCTTHSSDAWVTDSAAAATALASGSKTKNFAVGVDPDGKPLTTLLHDAERLGLATGLVTTSKITHATPAGFAAHVDQRAKEEEVARQYEELGIDVLTGGGAKYFPPARREKLESKGTKLLLISDDHVPYVLDRGADVPPLSRLTADALELLAKREKGFFLMVEGARIDMACHASDAAAAAAEMKDFDDAVRTVLEFAQKDGRTLVVVTADHATGGMAITEKAQALRDRFPRVKASAEAMMREAKKRPLRDVLKERAEIDDVTDEEIRLYESVKGPYDPASVIGEVVSRRLGVTFIPFEYRVRPPNTTHGHDGAMVPLYASGPGADRFTGTLDNTEIPGRIRGLTGWGR